MKMLITGVIIIILSLCGTYGWWQMTHNPEMDFKLKETGARSDLHQYNLMMCLYLMDHNNTFPQQLDRDTTIRILQPYMKFEERQRLSKNNSDDLLFSKLDGTVIFHNSLAGKRVDDEKPVVWVSVWYKNNQGATRVLNAWSNGETKISDKN